MAEEIDFNDFFDLTPTPQLLQILGDLKFKGWQCIAELIDNSIDAILNSKNISSEDKKIIVTIPTPGKIRAGEPVIIEDFADGMLEVDLQNAVKAGFSGKNTRDSIGLFGMGFNVATACLANKVEVWSSTKNMDSETGVLIDLKDMAVSKSFLRRKLIRPRRHDKKSGTEIKIYDFKKEADSLLKINDIRHHIKRAYTERIFDDNKISIRINQEEIRPFKFCTWSENVSVKVKYDEIPAYIEIDKLLRQEDFCERCRIWLGNNVQTTLKVECPSCHSADYIIKKDIHLVGWLGIQRYPDPDHYGIDISRNGRILRKLDKSLFYWDDERVKNDPRFQPEYPRDNVIYNGRIVGQIEANFILPKYTKDDFNSDDENWRLAVKYLRGDMPLQTELAEIFGFNGLNRSPLGSLFRGFRRIDPPGLKTLMFAKPDGSGKSDPTRQKNWKEKFYDPNPDPVYLVEETWLKEIEKAELRDTPGGFNPQNPTGRDTPGGGTPRPTPTPTPPKYPGLKKLVKALHFDLERLIDQKPIDLTVLEYNPESDFCTPIIFEPTGSIMKFEVYLNNKHPMFRDFADGYDDLIFMEVASIYHQLITNKQEWTLTRLYYELKSKYAPETMLSVSNLVTKASNLMRDIHNKLTFGNGISLPHAPNLSENDLKSLQKKFLDLEGHIISDIEKFILTPHFLKYLDLNYLFKFIEEFPEVIYDDKIFSLPYSELDTEARQHQLKKYTSYFNDVRWFMNDLSKEGDEAIKKLKQQIIRNRYSIEILYGNFIR